MSRATPEISNLFAAWGVSLGICTRWCHSWLYVVEKGVYNRFQIPLNSLLLGMVIELLLGLIYVGLSATFNAFSGVGVIFLTLSYACPVAVSLVLRGRRDIQCGSFNLGSLGYFCNIICIRKWLIPFRYSKVTAFVLSSELALWLVSPRYSIVSHAHVRANHNEHDELCLCRVCQICVHFRCLVWCMGSEEL
jgi:hypothetical protein